MFKKALAITFSLLVLLLVSCKGFTYDEQPRPSSDSEQRYEHSDVKDVRIPVDDAVYTIEGQVVADVETMSRQVAPASGFYTQDYGAFFGERFGGKGFVRLFVHSVSPATALAEPNQITLIKTSDTKASALLVGDIVTFRCRAQYEAVAAIRLDEAFNAAKVKEVEAWEWDYCRLVTPSISFERDP
jgi:hypothetical protein